MSFTLADTQTSTSQVVKIHPVTGATYLPSVQVLARSFVDDPVSIAVYPRFTDSRRVQALIVDFKAEVKICIRRGYPVVAENERTVLGAEVIYPPGRFPLPIIDQWYLLLSSFWGNGFYNLKDWLNWLKDVDKHHPREPHYYLEYIGVDPAYQGKGIGSVILQHLVDKADADGVGCYLENANSRNTIFYQRFGFEITEQREVIGVPTWFMWRPPVKLL